MPRCRTKKGSLTLRYEGENYVLDVSGQDLPIHLAESIRGHVNVVVEAGESDRPTPEKAGRGSRRSEKE